MSYIKYIIVQLIINSPGNTYARSLTAENCIVINKIAIAQWPYFDPRTKGIIGIVVLTDVIPDNIF